MSKNDSARQSRKLRILVIAESANPDWVSVPLVGWSHWNAISKITDSHLVTHIRNRENILKRGLTESEFTAIDTTAIEQRTYKVANLLRPNKDGGLTTVTAFSVIPYYYFEQTLWAQFGDRIKAGEWDVVHRVTPLTPIVPSLLAAKCRNVGVPFVLGPLNGGLPWPRGFGAARWKEQEWLTYLRAAYKLLPGYRATRRAASAIVCGSSETRSQIARAYRDKTVYIPENAIEMSRFEAQPKGDVSSPLKVVFVGRLTMYKGCDMLIEAAAPLIRAGKIKLDILGDGPQAAELRDLARREDLPESLFAGWVQHEELRGRLQEADVFAFPSIREFGGGVVLEMMALGIVPIVVGYGGPQELVTESTGFVLPMGSREQIVRALKEVLERLVAAPAGIRDIGKQARARVIRHFTWEAKALQMLEVYRWVLGERDQPDFGMPLPDLP